MFERTVFTYSGLEVRVTDQANEGILNVLERAVQGSDGGLRFSLQNISRRIAAYGDRIRFVSLYRKNQVTGTVGACFRIAGQGRLKYPATYIRYLAFHSLYQADVGWQHRTKTVIRAEKEDSFRQKTLELLTRPHLFDLPDVYEKDKHIMYALVESMNERSKNLVNQSGYDHVRSFLTVAFSRFSPKTDIRVTKLIPEEKPEMEKLLSDFYREYSFFCSDYAFHENKYYVLKEGNEIIAGVLALPASYRVYDIPGVWGWVMMKVLPGIPFFRRLFRPGEFHYLVLDAVYCKKGREKVLASLFESACASEGLNTGLMWMDDHSEFYERIRTEVKLGPLNRMLNAKPGLVYAKFINLDDAEKELFYDAPAYISGFDFS